MNKRTIEEIKAEHINQPNFVFIENYKNLWGVEIFKSGRKHIKEEHVYYCYTPENFDYWVYKNFIDELRDYEKKNNWEFRKTYNFSRYEIFGNLYLYQLNSNRDHQKVNFNKLGEYYKEHE